MKIYSARYNELQDAPKILGTSEDSVDDVDWINRWIEENQPAFGNCPRVFYSIPMEFVEDDRYKPAGFGVMAYVLNIDYDGKMYAQND